MDQLFCWCIQILYLLEHEIKIKNNNQKSKSALIQINNRLSDLNKNNY